MSVTTDLRDRVLAHQFSSARYASLIVTWLDEAQTYILRQTDTRSNEGLYDFTTVNSTPNYALPSDFRSIVGVFNDDSNTILVPLSIPEYEQVTTSYGTPQYYVIIGDDIYLYPTPNAAINISFRYYAMPETITEAVDPVIPADYHDILVDYALWRAYLAEHDYEAAAQHQAIYQQAIEKMKGELQSDTDEPYNQVRGAWGSYYS